MKKLIALLLVLLMLMTGCAQDAPSVDSTAPSVAPSVAPSAAPAYPTIEPMNTEGVVLDVAEYNGVKVSFPAEDWLFDTSLGALCLYAVEALGTNQAYNINIQTAAAAGLTIDEDGMEQLMAELGQYEGYITVDHYGIHQLYGEPVILMESTVQFTDAYIDEMIALGGFTEDQIESLGGREALLSIPPTTQIALYALKDDVMYIYVGTYYTEAQRQAVQDCITVLVATTEKA